LYNCAAHVGLGAGSGHIHAHQESWSWWCDFTEMVSKRIKVVHCLPIGNVPVSIELYFSRVDLSFTSKAVVLLGPEHMLELADCLTIII